MNTPCVKNLSHLFRAPLLAALWILSISVAAAEQGAGFTYEVNEATVTITKYDGSGGSVAIPDNIGGMPVIGIADWAFSFCGELTSVTLPNSVTRIGGFAFFYCTGLTSITLGNSVTSIGYQAFYNCAALSSIVVTRPNPSFSDRDGVLFNQDQTTLIQYPAGRVGSYVIPDTVTGIGVEAFIGCAGLTSITIANSVTSIGQYAFYGCTGLASIHLPESVGIVGYQAFYNCAGLTSITVDSGNRNYLALDGVLFNHDQTTLIQYPAGRPGSYDVPDSVTSIGENAFYYCGGLTSVTLPNSVTRVGDQAFQFCSGLTSITLPNSVTSLGQFAFYRCAGLTSIALPNSLASIGLGAFFGCAGLTSITLPNQVTSIADWEFYGCAGLTSITIPDSVTSIGGVAFSGCAGLTSITLPNRLSGIGDYAFQRCAGLTRITIPSSLSGIGNYVFDGDSMLTGVYFSGNAPASVGAEVFQNADQVIVYCLAGTTGWGEYFGGRSVVRLPAVEEPVVISRLAPSSVPAGSGGFTLSVLGSGFADGAQVLWNGSARTTERISVTEVHAAILAADIVSSQPITVASVQVRNADDKYSNLAAFTVVGAAVERVDSKLVAPQETVVVSTIPSVAGQSGVQATLNTTAGGGSRSVTAGTYSSNPASGTFFDVGGGFVDLQVAGAVSGDSLSANIYYPSTVTGDTEANLVLMHYNGSVWVPTRSSGGLAPIKDPTDNLDGTVSGGRFTVVFDNTSVPKVTELNGTVFAPSAAAAPANQPPVPGSYTLILWKDQEGTITVSRLVSAARDPEGNTITLATVDSFSVKGGTIAFGGGTISYTPPLDYTGPDSFQYTLKDRHEAAAQGIVRITINPPASSSSSPNQLGITSVGGGPVTVRFAGIPLLDYDIQACSDLGSELPGWVTISTIPATARANGVIEFTDAHAGEYSQRFYRTALKP